MDNYQTIRPHGQGSLLTTFGAVAAIVLMGYKNPYLLPIPDAAIDKAKEIVVELRQVKPRMDCVMTVLSRRPPPLGCNLEQK